MHQTIARAPDADLGRLLDAHRADLVGYCYRMLASPCVAPFGDRYSSVPKP